jgi:hypothetical protein
MGGEGALNLDSIPASSKQVTHAGPAGHKTLSCLNIPVVVTLLNLLHVRSFTPAFLSRPPILRAKSVAFHDIICSFAETMSESAAIEH